MNRRSFLKRTTAGMVAAISLSTAAQTKHRPNVLIIYSDDQGSIDLNCYGASDLSTPNLDALAAQGVWFTQFYAASSVCAPSRAGLLSGRYPQQTGVAGNVQSRPEKFAEKGGLHEELTLLPEAMQAAGYRTGHFGKWHLGANPGPNGHGFDESFGFLGGCIDKWSHFNYGGQPWGAYPKRHDLYRNGKEVFESGSHCGDLIVRETCRFMESDTTKPFFAYVAFGTPHYPMQPYDKYREHYKTLPEPRRSYAALVSTLDEQVGNILKQLDALGLRENTIIIFQSDQGHSTEARCNYGGGNAGPYRGAKASLFEGGLRVPAMISWPGKIPQNEVRHQFCTGCDWYPTVAELCGVDTAGIALDGTSLTRVIKSERAPAPHTRWHWQLGRQWAVRDGDMKLILHAKDTTDGREVKQYREPLLFNLAEDPGEQHDLAQQEQKTVKRFMKLHQEWTHAH